MARPFGVSMGLHLSLMLDLDGTPGAWTHYCHGPRTPAEAHSRRLFWNEGK